MRFALLTLAALALAPLVASAATPDLGITAAYTPYDAYMTPVKRVLATAGRAKADLERVTELMRVGRSFRYVHSTPYHPASPAQTAARRAGDCKDKALWLCDQLRDPSVRFVIGKVKRQARVSHAWVMWENEGRWWILDCTLSRRPIPLDRVGKGDYVPLYSYGKDATYRHARTALMTAQTTPAATAPVAAKATTTKSAKTSRAFKGVRLASR